MSRHIACSIVLVVAVFAGGCPQPIEESERSVPPSADDITQSAPPSSGADESPADPAEPIVDAEEFSCPFVVDDQPLFTLTIPCGTIRLVPTAEIPRADYEMYYFDDEWAQTYLAAVVAPEFLSIYSAPGVAQTGVSFRWDGTMRTSFGDLLLLATARLETGYTFNYAYGLLADGRLLMIGTEDGNPLGTSFTGSVSLADTDGSDIGTGPMEGVPVLAAPAPDGLVVLNDDAVYRVVGSTELHRLTSWEAGATIMVHDASLMSNRPFFLTNRSEWVSVEADYVGISSRSIIHSLTDLEYDTVEFVLADGSRWRVAYGDKGEAQTWREGDAVAIVEDSGSFLGYTIVRLRTGQTLIVEPD